VELLKQIPPKSLYIKNTLALFSLLIAFWTVETIEQGIVLENDFLVVELQQSYPYVNNYLLKENGEVIYGDLVNETFTAYILYQNNFHNIEPSIDSITQNSDSVCYHLRNEINMQLAVTFDFCYILSGNSIQVVFSNVQESSGYKLIYVRSPDLLTIQGSQSGAQMVFPFADGRLIDISATTPGYEDVDLSHEGWSRPLLAGMIYHNNLMGILSYDHLDMVMYERVIDHATEGRLGMIGMVFNYRYAPTNFNSTSFIEVFDENTTSLSTNLTFVADYNNDLEINWIDGANYLRNQVQASPDQRYTDSFITKVGRTGIGHSFEHLKNFEKLFHLTDHNKIIGYLLSYNADIFEIFGVDEDIDPDFATLDELINFFQTAEDSFNVFLGFHDNYNDYYPGTPGYDPSLRVILENGNPAQGWSLPAFPTAYRTDPLDYASAKGITRVHNTIARYPIEESHHLDVFNVLFELDYSLGSPSSRERNRRGLQLIIDEFDTFGVDITSEVLTGPYVESGIGWFLDTPRIISTALSFDTEFIPLLEFIYHGKTLYGLFEDIYYDVLPPDQVEIYAFLEPLLLGANSASHISYLASDDLMLDRFYLIDLPWMALNERFMENYEARGSYRKITYDPDTFVEIDYKSNTYTVQVDGRVIGQNYSTFFPKDENIFLIYSRDAKSLSHPIPIDWSGNIILQKLNEDGTKEKVPFQIANGIINFNVDADTPYKLINLESFIYLPLTRK
jgi:hypothetical protein